MTATIEVLLNIRAQFLLEKIQRLDRSFSLVDDDTLRLCYEGNIEGLTIEDAVRKLTAVLTAVASKQYTNIVAIWDAA